MRRRPPGGRMGRLAAGVLLGGFVSVAGAQDRPPITKNGFVETADKVKIRYLDVGSGPAMLFVPGWTMPAEIWEPQITYFAHDHRVVAIDPRAQGQSSQTQDGLYPAARAGDIKAVVDELKLAPVILVGWSLAVGEIASYVDQFGTDTVAAIVLVDGVAGRDLDPVTMPQFFQWLLGFEANRREAATAFVRSMYATPQEETYLERIASASLQTPTASAVALIVGGQAADLRPALNKIDRPTLIVAATKAYMSAYQDMHQRIAGSRLEVFDGAGHAVFVDQADRFNALLDEFMRALTGPSV